MLRTILAAIALLAGAAHAAPLGSGFGYQGELRDANQPASGIYDFEVALFSVAADGSALATSTHEDIAVANGLFALTLDYTSVPFETATQYWLELRVRAGDSAGAYTPLLPRQSLDATPYALHARSVDAGGLPPVGSARPTWTSNDIFLPGTAPTSAGDSSATVGVDGLPIAAVFDDSNADLLALHCDNPSCTERTVTALDSAGIVGRANSIMIGTNGKAAVSYFDETNGDLKIAFCDDTRCTTADVTTVDANVGASRRVVLLPGDTLSTVVALYHDAPNGDIVSTPCYAGPFCGARSVLLSTGDVGNVMDAGRVGYTLYIAYSDLTAGALKLARCYLGSACDSIVVDAGGSPSDVALVATPDGRPLVLYIRAGELRSAKCSTPACDTVAAGPVLYQVAGSVVATLGADGLPFVVVVNASKTILTHLHCVDQACSAAPSGGGYGSPTVDARPGLTIGSHGFPIVTSRASIWQMKVQVCDSAECGVGTRRR